MTLEHAAQLLGVTLSASEAEVKAAWRKQLMLHHPDHGGDGELITELKQAYELLLQPRVCPQCQGAKRIKLSRGFNTMDIICSGCGGTGVRDLNASPAT